MLAAERLRGNHDKASLGIFSLRDERPEESDNLPDPDVLAQEIIANDLGAEGTQKSVKIRG